MTQNPQGRGVRVVDTPPQRPHPSPPTDPDLSSMVTRAAPKLPQRAGLLQELLRISLLERARLHEVLEHGAAAVSHEECPG